MKTVWKYEIGRMDYTQHHMPLGAKPLHFDVQHGALAVWCLVNPNAPEVPHRFRLAGTGHDLPHDPGEYVGTVIAADGRLVLHLFDMGEM